MDANHFMKAIFGDCQADTTNGVPVVCQGVDSMAWRWRPDMDLGPFTHWCISTVRADNPRQNVLSRKRENLVKTYAIILDDIGTKILIEKLMGRPKPSFILETSPGNHQWVYMFKEPIDPDEAVALMRALADAGFTDPGSTKPAQLARLPGSIKQGRTFAARVLP